MSSFRSTTTRMTRMPALVALSGSLIALTLLQTSAAGAATSKTTKGKTTKRAVTPVGGKPVPIPVAVTAGRPAPSCGTPVTTTVAGMKNTKFHAAINIYAEPSADSNLKNSLAIGIESNNTLAFTVVKAQGDWLLVNSPVRPNGTTGWIRKSEVNTFTHQYLIKIDVAARRLTLCNAGKSIQTETVAVGKPIWPTPTGKFYTLDHVKTKGGPGGAYGPYAIGLSGFSEVPELEKWNGGDGRIAIHGTDQPGLLGTAVSHGCIRVSNDAITKLIKTLPLGVPVEIY
jgi:lipoprotein-anchoring transpeptidase ErfK/SrfK